VRQTYKEIEKRRNERRKREREREREQRDGCCFEAFCFLSSLPPLTLILPGSEGHTKQQKFSLSFYFLCLFIKQIGSRFKPTKITFRFVLTALNVLWVG
jgi:hypothetical protein